jgi:hypothetical protein
LNIIGFIVVFTRVSAQIIYINKSDRKNKNAAVKGKGVDIKLKERVHVDTNFYNEVKLLGLTKTEASVLEKVLKVNNENPSVVFRDAGKVDEYFKQAYNNIMRNKEPDSIQGELLELFSIRNAIEYFHAFKEKRNDKIVARGFRRKDLNAPCVVYKVIVKNSGRKSKGKKTLAVQNDAVYEGKVIDVSQGGCAIVMAQSVKTGWFIKIDFKINREPVAALGEVLRANKDGANWVYNIKFLKLSKKSIIALNTFVFDYR